MSTDDVWKRIEHAQLLIDIKRPQQAIEQLATIPLGDPEVSCRVNCLLANAHLINHELDKAYACARRAIEASPNNLGALYWLAYLEGDPKLALKYATRLVELAPEHGFSHTMRAHTLARNFQWEEALNAAREGERLDPEDPFALNTLARVLARNDKEAALEVYQRVLSLEPDDVVARQGSLICKMMSAPMPAAASTATSSSRIPAIKSTRISSTGWCSNRSSASALVFRLSTWSVGRLSASSMPSVAVRSPSLLGFCGPPCSPCPPWTLRCANTSRRSLPVRARLAATS